MVRPDASTNVRPDEAQALRRVPPASRARPARASAAAAFCSAGIDGARSTSRRRTAPLAMLCTLLRGQRLVFERFQLRRDVALGILERLPSAIVVRNAGRVRVGDLDIKAVHPVELDLEIGDAGTLALTRLEREQKFSAMIIDGTQLVQFRIEALCDHTAIADLRRGLRRNGADEQCRPLRIDIEIGTSAARSGALPGAMVAASVSRSAGRRSSVSRSPARSRGRAESRATRPAMRSVSTVRRSGRAQIRVASGLLVPRSNRRMASPTPPLASAVDA